MRRTGIIRTFDDLGRIVVPREIRRQLNINEQDSCEIFINDDGDVVLHKISKIQDVDGEIERIKNAVMEVEVDENIVGPIFQHLNAVKELVKDIGS